MANCWFILDTVSWQYAFGNSVVLFEVSRRIMLILCYISNYHGTFFCTGYDILAKRKLHIKFYLLRLYQARLLCMVL